MKKIAALVLLSCLLSACSDTVDMTYDCNPSGAIIYEQGGRRLGSCPVTVQYQPNEAQLKEGKFYTRKLTAVWSDGISASVPSLTVDIPSNHKAQYVFVHGQTPVGQAEATQMSVPNFKTSPSFQPYPTADQDSTSGMSASMTSTSLASPAASLPAHQDQDLFDEFNKKATCKISNWIGSVASGCPSAP